jgi:hypothetical protein
MRPICKQGHSVFLPVNNIDRPSPAFAVPELRQSNAPNTFIVYVNCPYNWLFVAAVLLPRRNKDTVMSIKGLNTINLHSENLGNSRFSESTTATSKYTAWSKEYLQILFKTTFINPNVW